MYAHAPLLGPKPRVVRVAGMHLLSWIMGKDSKWINRISQISQWTTPFLPSGGSYLEAARDAHLEAASEKSCSVFWKLTNYPD